MLHFSFHWHITLFHKPKTILEVCLFPLQTIITMAKPAHIIQFHGFNFASTSASVGMHSTLCASQTALQAPLSTSTIPGRLSNNLTCPSLGHFNMLKPTTQPLISNYLPHKNWICTPSRFLCLCFSETNLSFPVKCVALMGESSRNEGFILVGTNSQCDKWVHMGTPRQYSGVDEKSSGNCP